LLELSRSWSRLRLRLHNPPLLDTTAQLLPLCACLAIGPAIGADAASNADQHAPPGLISEGLARFAPYL